MTSSVYESSSTQSRTTSAGLRYLLWIGLALAILVGVGRMLWPGGGTVTDEAQLAAWRVPEKFNGDRAMQYLVQICAIGPRVSGTPGMLQQQQLLEPLFAAQGAVVEWQTFQVRHPQTGQAVEMKNLVARWFPEQPQRVLICAHYDTRPFPDKDPKNKRGVFIGANDGASGAACLLELAHHLRELPGTLGVDLVLFDGEELVYQEQRDPYFLGSTHFAKLYAAGQLPGKYEAGVLLDMIGDRELQIYYEVNSVKYARKVCDEIWETAASMKISAFIPRSRHEVRDDHLPLNSIGNIPAIDLIDFDYPRPSSRGPNYWHTTEDTPDKCSGKSLAAVAAVLHEWLKVRSNRGVK